MSNEYWDKADLVDNLWRQYEKSEEFALLDYRPKAISKNHRIVIGREERGLLRIIRELKKSLEQKSQIYLDQLKLRQPSDWIREWKHFHDLLFKEVLKDRGSFRKVDVRFGSHTDEEIYSVPKTCELQTRIEYFADTVCYKMRQNFSTLEEYLELMAGIHHGFICLHPFYDGNGRIGRALIDQLALAFGLPMVMGGYPRSSESQRKSYHLAIREAAAGDEYRLLKLWIRNKIDSHLDTV